MTSFMIPNYAEGSFNIIIIMIALFLLVIILMIYLLSYVRRCKNIEKTLIQKEHEFHNLLETLIASEDELKAQNEALVSQRNMLESQKNTLVEKQKTIEDYAFYDCLTHLPNRHTLKLDIQKLLMRSSQTVIKGALFFIDFDNFKHINDHYGHTFGDEMLVNISERLSTSVIDCGKVYRFGGDEFIVLTEDIYDYDTINYLAKKLYTDFEQPLYVRNHEFLMSFSMGIAIVPLHGSMYDEIIGSADMAMYSAKNAGKNQFAYYDENTKKKSTYISQLQEEFQNDVYNDALLIHYQPVYDIKTNGIQFIEAMLRWQSSLGNIPPSTFLAISKELNLMDHIHKFVFNEVCDLNNIVNNSDKPVYISFNLSSKELLAAIAIKDLENILNEKKTDPSTICLEISETIIENDFDAVFSQIMALRTVGFRIIIDDFGKEYLSLNYLKKLPIDFLKIDISFFYEHANDHSILKALIDIIHDLNIGVIIKGIESDTHLNYLEHFSYKYVQGYYYGYPVTKEKIISTILEEDIKIYHIRNK
ncbi:putative bifunctional diguanylate cyclase/phosphodiesterase [Fusibacter ferrireducens]|uniref:EAL domain-containing protein n=1 Tax=Fusibacter ferrireducens TaxID=2785058 RepID=A0ABR9ZZ28_9FIRM|nr:EAL domain-containing protein [Fusibacter ferrireducens]MBF4695711.1 EAL domain-containing protein [Fusibacter ferrireducens]